MRQDIDQNPQRIKNILLDDRVRKEFLKDAPKQEHKVVDAFVASNAETMLKTKPKGYDADHPDISLLRLRSYTVGRKLSDEELLEKGALDCVAELLSCMKPLIAYLNSVVMPDEQNSDDDGDEGSNEGSDEAA